MHDTLNIGLYLFQLSEKSDANYCKQHTYINRKSYLGKTPFDAELV